MKISFQTYSMIIKWLQVASLAFILIFMLINQFKNMLYAHVDLIDPSAYIELMAEREIDKYRDHFSDADINPWDKNLILDRSDYEGTYERPCESKMRSDD